MNSTDKSSIIERIKKCLALGNVNKNNSTAEAETALAMAQKLMAEHNIAMTEVQFNSETQTLKGNVEEFSFGLVNSKWRQTLPHVVNILCNTKHYWHDRKTLMYVGLKDDIEMAVLIYKELITAILRIRRGAMFESRSSFCYGMVMNLYHRAQAMHKAETRPTNTNALMVVKDVAIKNFLAAKGLVSRRGNSRRVSSGDYDRGYQAGQGIALGRKRAQVSGTRQLTYQS